jgi:hypothetical protein
VIKHHIAKDENRRAGEALQKLGQISHPGSVGSA